MLVFIVLGSVLIAAAAYGRFRDSSRLPWFLLAVAANATGLSAMVYFADASFGPESVVPKLAYALVVFDMSILAAAVAGVSFRTIVAYGLPTAAFVAMSASITDGRPAAILSGALFLVFLFAYAVHQVVLTSSPSTIDRASLWIFGIWFALAVSSVEFAWRALRQRIFSPLALAITQDGLDYQDSEAFLVTAASNLVLFSCACLILSVASVAWKRLLATRFVAFTFSWMASLIVFPIVLLGLPWAFTVVYALALALGLEHRISASPVAFRRFALRTAPLFAAVVVLLSAWYPLRDRWDADRRVAALAKPATAHPNVLLLVMDTMRRDRMGVYGYPRDTTPNLDRWAQRGLLYDNAVANSSWTLPSHASMFTGRWCHEHGASFVVPLDEKYPTLAEALSQAGFETADFLGNIWYCGRWTGLNRGFLQYNDRLPISERLESDSVLSKMFLGLGVVFPTAQSVTNDFLAWSAKRRTDRPFFAFLNYYDPHSPYHVSDAEFDVFSSLAAEERSNIRLEWLRSFPAFLPSNSAEVQLAVDTQDAAIKYMDHHIGRLLDELDRRGVLRNTLVLITSDHGEHFGERGLYLHGTSLYRQLIDAPLIALLPGEARPTDRVRECIGLQDVPRTVLEFLGVDGAATFPGSSFVDLWDSEGRRKPLPERPIFSQLGKSVRLPDQLNSEGTLYSVVADGHHYIRYPRDRPEEVFDFWKDRADAHDLSAQDSGIQVVDRLRGILLAELNDAISDDVTLSAFAAPIDEFMDDSSGNAPSEALP